MSKTIDLTPTWEGLVTVLLHIAQNATTVTARQEIHAELTQMARAADKWNAHCKKG
jgi:hypothetical protein